MSRKGLYMLEYIDDPLEGPDAVQRMQEIMFPNQECLNLVESVASFFGNHIEFGYSPHETSRWWPNVESDRPHVLAIALARSERKREALSHELLHAQLMVQGYPWLHAHSGWSTDRFHGNAPNWVDHLVMAPRFVALGLDSSKFSLAPLWRLDSLLNDSRADLKFWCGEWFCFWSHWHDTGSEESRERAEEIINVFRNTQFARIVEVSRQVNSWYERGTFNDPATFEDSYDEFAQIMGVLPEPREHWCRFEPGENGPVVRWNPPRED